MNWPRRGWRQMLVAERTDRPFGTALQASGTSASWCTGSPSLAELRRHTLDALRPGVSPNRPCHLHSRQTRVSASIDVAVDGPAAHPETDCIGDETRSSSEIRAADREAAPH